MPTIASVACAAYTKITNNTDEPVLQFEVSINRYNSLQVMFYENTGKLYIKGITFYLGLPRISWIAISSFFLWYKHSQEWSVYDKVLFSNAFYPPICHEFQEKKYEPFWQECTSIICPNLPPGRVAQSVGHLIRKSGSWVRYLVWQRTFVSPSAFSRRAVVSYWRKYVHEVLVNRLGGLSLPRKSVVRLTDRPDMTLDVYRRRKTTIRQQQPNLQNNILLECLTIGDRSSYQLTTLAMRKKYVDPDTLCFMFY